MELKILSEKGKGNKKINAKSSLKLIDRYEISEIDAKTVDDSVLALAEKTNGFVLTNDKELKDRLKEKSLKVIILRAKKKLVII
jgi:rRNA-processing protein FCF1